MLPSEVAEALNQSDPNASGFNSQASIQPKIFSQRTNFLMGSTCNQQQQPQF
jgi:hypothetical protein